MARLHHYYIIRNEVDYEEYVGCTTKTLRRRMYDHHSDSKRSTSKLYNHMREIGFDRFYMQELGTAWCTTKHESRCHEQVYMNVHQPSLNMCRASTGRRARRRPEQERRQNVQCVKDYRIRVRLELEEIED